MANVETGTFPVVEVGVDHNPNYYAGPDAILPDEVARLVKEVSKGPPNVTVQFVRRKTRHGEDRHLRRLIKSKIQGLPPGDVKDILTALAKHTLRGNI